MSSIHRTNEWFTLTRRMRPLFRAQIEAGEATCVDCGRAVLPGETWAVGHIIAASLAPELALEDWNVGVSHHGRSGPNCNQKSGGAMGARKTNAKRKRAQGEEFPKWY